MMSVVICPTYSHRLRPCVLSHVALSPPPPGNPAEKYGAYLESAGFARQGQETLISGITGEEMPCDIFIGIVYYQRLRHMVSDKFQVGRQAGRQAG